MAFAQVDHVTHKYWVLLMIFNAALTMEIMLIDFAKAFNKVSHSKLCYQLYILHYEIIASYYFE